MDETARRLNVLLVDDDEDDSALVAQELSRGGDQVAIRRVATARQFDGALAGERWDLVLVDHAAPELSALDALAIIESRGADVPLILLSGTIGEEAAVEMLKAGAADVVLRSNIGRLGPVAERESRAATNRRTRR